MHAAALLGVLAVAAPQEVWTREEMAADLAQLADAVRAEWSYLEHRSATSGLDLEATLAESLAALEGVRTREDFAGVLRRFLADLRDGHGSVSLTTGAPARRYLPLELASCAEGAVVVSAPAESTVPPEARAPTRGDLLVAIDGRPVPELLEELKREISASTPSHRASRAFAALLHTTAEEVEVELVDPEGARHAVRLRSGARPLVERERENWALSWPAEGVGLLRIDSFAVRDWQAWLAADVDEREPFLRATHERMVEILGELEGAHALILDLRGNGGGTDALGSRLAEHLLAEPFRYFRLSALRDGVWSPPGGLTYGSDDSRPVFAGRLVALTDGRCFSVTDNFLSCLRDLHPRFTVVGRPTGGGTGAPRTIVTLDHSGAAVRLCTMRVLGPKSGMIEGRGTSPDVQVTWTRADVLAGRDPDLAAALRALDE